MKIALLHRYPAHQIKETNAAFPYLFENGIDVLGFKSFNRLNQLEKIFKSILWIFYAPLLVWGKGYDVIYCDDSFPFYPALVKMVSPKSKIVLRIGDFHLMYYTSGWLYRLLHHFEVKVWKMADKVIVISEAMWSYFWDLGINAEIALDPVDLKEFVPIYREQSFKGDVMFHGILTKNKNVDVLLAAARLMRDIDFTIIGDGPDMKRLKSMAPENVYFTGWLPFSEIRHEISNCSVGVALRSHNQGNDYVVTSPFLQYGAMAKPCIVTRRKVYGDYKWQFEDAFDLVTQLRLILDNPIEHGQKLREFIVKHHDAEKIGAQIWGILEQA